MNKLGIICAFNPGNAGMHSVDLAAQMLFAKMNAKVTLINFQKRPWRFVKRPFTVGRRWNWLAKFDTLIFWGDFQNNPVYGTRDFPKREIEFGYARGLSEGIENWKELHLLAANFLPSTARIASIGNCFLGSHVAAETFRLSDALKAFVANAVVVAPREARSALELGRVCCGERNPKIVPALDTAMLLPRAERLDYRQKEFFGYCFGRSNITDIEASIEDLSARLGIQACAIPWALGDRYVDSAKVFSEARRAMSRCRFVLTDIYHLTVNAMNAGIPVITLSNPTISTRTTLDDEKKIALAEQLGTGALQITMPSGAPLRAHLGEICAIHDRTMDREIDFSAIYEDVGMQRDRFFSLIRQVIGA